MSARASGISELGSTRSTVHLRLGYAELTQAASHHRSSYFPYLRWLLSNSDPPLTCLSGRATIQNNAAVAYMVAAAAYLSAPMFLLVFLNGS